MPDLRQVDDDAALYAAVATEMTAFATGLVGHVGRALTCCRARWSGRSRRPRGRRSRIAAPTCIAPFSTRRRLGIAARRSGVNENNERRPFPTRSCRTFAPTAAAVDRLSVQQRAVILLTYWMDLDPKSTAQRLGISEGAVRRLPRDSLRVPKARQGINCNLPGSRSGPRSCLRRATSLFATRTM